MSVQLLDKTRKINKLLHNNNSSKVVFNDICEVLSEILESNVLVISKKGKVLGISITPNVEEIKELIDDEVGGHIDELLNERFLGVLSTKENVNLETLGFESGDVKKYQAIINPIDIAGERLGTVFMYKCGEGYDIDDTDYDKYAKIAPTVYIADGTRTDEDLFRYIADLVGKKDAAEAYIAEFNDKVATVKDEIVGIVGDRTVSILEVWPQEIYAMGSHFARGGSILYDMWGLKAPEAIQGPMVEGDEAYKVISVEALPDYAGDFICYGVLDGADSAYVDDSQLWKNLPAVKAGRLMPYEQVAFMHRDPITLTNQLEAFTDFFRAHADTAA